MLQPLVTSDAPPTYFKTDMFTSCFQVRMLCGGTFFAAVGHTLYRSEQGDEYTAGCLRWLLACVLCNVCLFCG